MQLLYLKADKDPNLSTWLKRKENVYTSATIQNEIIKIMGVTLLRSIAHNIRQSTFFTVMADEATDSSNKEQVTLTIRWVTVEFDVHEKFLGLYQVDSMDAATLTSVIKDTFIRMNLSISRLRGQCYNGASTMSGAKSGIAKQICDLEPRAVFTHCYGHSLNLAASDSIKNSKLMKNALGTTHEITKLIKYSPRRDAIFLRLKDTLPSSSAPGIRVLCPTRWTVRADSLKSVMENYEALESTWVEAADIARDTETKARLHGVSVQMKSFDFIFGSMLGEMILRHTDNLSRTLQQETLSAAEGQQIALMTENTLRSLRTDKSYEMFWKRVEAKVNSHDVQEPQVPRQENKRSLPISPQLIL